MIFDYLPESWLKKIINIEQFAACLVFDKWTANSDGRQAVFSRASKHVGFKAHFIDQGYCFNAGEWSFPDLALHGVYYRNLVYRHVTGWDSFEPVLSRAEQADKGDLWECASFMPSQWYQGDHDGLCRLVDALHNRRSLIRGLITAFRESSRQPFPNWKEPVSVAVPSESPPQQIGRYV